MKKIKTGYIFALALALAIAGSIFFFQKEDALVTQKKYPDLLNPEKVPTSDGKSYFLFGSGNPEEYLTPRKLIIALPGHGNTAEPGFEAWIPYLENTDYDLAVLNWWDGEGETPNDYYRPEEILKLTQDFLATEGYSTSDFIILEGFSRGSANTYAVAANDAKSETNIFDGYIANAGKYEKDFPVFADGSLPSFEEWTTYLKNTTWVLVCGGLDPKPEQSGCEAMKQTEDFLKEHGANVLETLTDPNEGHGAFHQSSLNLPQKALELLENSQK